MRFSITVVILLAWCVPAHSQFLNRIGLERVNHHLAGQVVDYTDNHQNDRRVFSRILAMPRDLYVYLPPGYDPARAYPLVLFFYMADVDEHYFTRSNLLREVDTLISSGLFPPAVLACPDGTSMDWNQLNAKHSLYVNGLGGRFEDHVLYEVIPFLTTHYSIRPGREAHALIGFSAGGYGAMGMAIKHRHFFSTVVTLGGPLNLRYFNSDQVYFEDFNPETYRWKTYYNPREVIGVFYAGLLRVRARRFMVPVFGDGDVVVERIKATNPADLIFSTDLKPAELAIYANYPGRDSFNFDAQVESFQWLAAQKGIELAVVRDSKRTHSLAYFRANIQPAMVWLGQHLPGAAEGLLKKMGSSAQQEH
jgi:pimeloyl-ACP methyl ester carboxylesterase